MADTVFAHMELEGPADRVVGFIDGVRVGAAVDTIWVHGEDDYDLESMMDSIKERMGMETHVVLPLDLARLIEDRLSRSKLVKATVSWIHEIDYAELDFDFRCFSKEVGAEIRKLLETDLPAGLRSESYEVDEQVADEAKGVELYAHMHDYTLSGSGRYVGTVPAVFAMAERLRDQDFVNPGKVRLQACS